MNENDLYFSGNAHFNFISENVHVIFLNVSDHGYFNENAHDYFIFENVNDHF